MHFSVRSIYCPKNENYDFVLILRKKKCGNRRQLPFFGKIKHMYFEWVSNRPRIEVWGCGFLNLCTSIFWESNWPRIIYLQYCTLLLSPCTELEVIVPIWEFSLKSRLGVSFRVIISVFCLFFSRPLNAYPMSIFVYNMGIHICIAMHH